MLGGESDDDNVDDAEDDTLDGEDSVKIVMGDMRRGEDAASGEKTWIKMKDMAVIDMEGEEGEDGVGRGREEDGDDGVDSGNEETDINDDDGEGESPEEAG